MNGETRLTVVAWLARGSCRDNRRENQSRALGLWHRTKSGCCRWPSLRGRYEPIGLKTDSVEVQPSWNLEEMNAQEHCYRLEVEREPHVVEKGMTVTPEEIRRSTDPQC